MILSFFLAWLINRREMERCEFYSLLEDWKDQNLHKEEFEEMPHSYIKAVSLIDVNSKMSLSSTSF